VSTLSATRPAASDADDTVLAIEDLKVSFGSGTKQIRAVDGVDLTLKRGETLALLGESGSGKSVTLRSVLRLHDERRTRISGRIRAVGRDVLELSQRELADFRGRQAAMIFQEPMLALDPVYTLGQQIIEAIRRHERVDRAEARDRARVLFELVQIPSASQRLDAYPHEMSGGMRQRAMIALALACRPRLLLADEPTTALDATVQIQILLLLRDLQRDFGLAMVFVTHDIGAAIEVADTIAVMYAGRIVESGPVRKVARTPAHPYTQGLLATRAAEGGLNAGLALAGGSKRTSRLPAIPGSPPDPADLPPGCAFAPRCSKAEAACRAAPPPPRMVRAGQMSRCIK